LEPLANMQLDAARGFFKLRFWVHSWRRSMVALISGPEVQLH
jgi:hypothetical protein